MSFSGKERRQHPRAQDRLIVAFELGLPLPVNMSTDVEEYPAVAVDVSEGGLGLDVDRPLPMDTQVHLRFELLNSAASDENLRQRLFKLDGRVRHCSLIEKQLYRIGVKFEQVQDEEREFIAAYARDLKLKQS